MIYTIGETVYDIIFKNGQPIASKAGGSMLNATVSLGRLKAPVAFISEFGSDSIGNEIIAFLQKNNINTNYVYRYIEGKTSIALAFLNQNNDAQYSFYKQLPANRLDIQYPIINSNDIILFGSFFAISKEVRNKVLPFLHYAKSNGALLVYDPNFRKAHIHELKEMLPLIEENMSLASIIKGSNEDFEMIYGTTSISETYSKVSEYCTNLIYTCNSKGVYLKTSNCSTFVNAKELSPISTIGAGDNFNAGIVYAINCLNISNNAIDHISTTEWERIVKTGVDFASEVCLSYDNYISDNYAQNYSL